MSKSETTLFETFEVMPDGGLEEVSPSSKSEVAYHDYLGLGTGRSLNLLHRKYLEMKEKGVVAPPTSSLKTLRKWARNYNWEQRAEIKNFELMQTQDALITRQHLEITRGSWRSPEDRLEKLSELADILWAEIQEEENRWLVDVKQIGGGRNAERVNLRRFNSPLLEQFRRTLEDISKEMGHRREKLDVEENITLTEHQIIEVRDQRWKEVQHLIPDLVEDSKNVIDGTYREDVPFDEEGDDDD